MWSLFETGGAVPSTVWLDHNMRVFDAMNNAGSWSISSRIKSMLEDCGECYVGGSLIEDAGSNSQSYQQYCCEEFGGEYFEFSDVEQNYCQGSDATWVKLCSACSGTVDSDGDVIIEDGDLVIGTAGHGIDFSASSDGAGSVSVSNEVLSDYEEGTWTPTFPTLDDATVTTNKVVDNAITTAKILDSNITTAKIADDAVTNAKIANEK